MGLLDILTQLGQATAERARAKEFGADYRQRWQESADKHTLSETQNALSQENLKSKVRETENLYMVARDLYPDLSPDQALARMESDRVRRTVEGEQLDITGKKQGLRFGETAEQRAAAQAGRQEQLFPVQLQGAQQGVEFGKTKQEREQVELDRIRAGKEPVPTYHREPGSYVPLFDDKGTIVGSWNTNTGTLKPGPGGSGPVVAPEGGFRRTPLPQAATKEKAGIDSLLGIVQEVKKTLQDPATAAKIGSKFGGPFGAKSRITGMKVAAGIDTDPATVRLRSLISMLAPQQAFELGGRNLTTKEWGLIAPGLPLQNEPLTSMLPKIQILEEKLIGIREGRFGSEDSGQPGAVQAPTTGADWLKAHGY